MSKLLITLTLVCLAWGGMSAQTTADVLILFGEVKEYKQKAHKMVDVVLRIEQDDMEYDEILTSEEGDYQVFLDLGHRYRFWFEKEGYFSKNFIIDTSALTEEQKTGGFTFDVDMTMIPRLENLELAMTEDPISIATYDPDIDMILFDPEMSSQYSAQLEAALENVSFKKKKKKR